MQIHIIAVPSGLNVGSYTQALSKKVYTGF